MVNKKSIPLYLGYGYGHTFQRHRLVPLHGVHGVRGPATHRRVLDGGKQLPAVSTKVASVSEWGLVLSATFLSLKA